MSATATLVLDTKAPTANWGQGTWDEENEQVAVTLTVNEPAVITDAYYTADAASFPLYYIDGTLVASVSRDLQYSAGGFYVTLTDDVGNRATRMLDMKSPHPPGVVVSTRLGRYPAPPDHGPRWFTQGSDDPPPILPDRTKGFRKR